MFSPGDIRSYLYLLKPSDENFKLDSTKDLNLGIVELTWRNYFGDSGQLEIGPLKATARRSNLEIDLNPLKEEILKFEQPSICKFRLHNVSDKQMNLTLLLQESSYSKECLITDCEPTYLGLLDPQKFIDVSLHLFPKVCGVISVSGLII